MEIMKKRVSQDSTITPQVQETPLNLVHKPLIVSNKLSIFSNLNYFDPVQPPSSPSPPVPSSTFFLWPSTLVDSPLMP